MKILERSDGVLVRVDDAITQKGLLFSYLKAGEKNCFTMHLTHVEFDHLFRFTPSLMNPNRKSERYVWIAERLTLNETESGRSLILSPDSVVQVCVPKLESAVQLPFGRVSFHEKQKLRDQVIELEKRRIENISVKEQQRDSSLTELAQRFRIEAARSEALRKERILKEEQERAEEQLLLEATLAEKARRDEQLNALRDAHIASRALMTDSQSRDRIKAVIEAGKSNTDLIRHTVLSWRKKRLEQETAQRSELTQFNQEMHLLHEKREMAYERREDRCKVKEREYLLSRQNRLNYDKRKAIRMKEKKQEQVYALFGPLN